MNEEIRRELKEVEKYLNYIEELYKVDLITAEEYYILRNRIIEMNVNLLNQLKVEDPKND